MRHRATVELQRPASLMAVVNATPDSFSDGGQLPVQQSALEQHITQLVDQGAAWLDLGAESSRPGSERISCGRRMAAP